jgi:hypothetical protein
VESKQFSIASIVSLTSGMLLCDFGDMHHLAEYVMGHPIWTHEFASKPMWDVMKSKLLEQHPTLPAAVPEGTGESNWQRWRDSLVAQFGATLPIAKGEEERPADPMTTARAMLGPDKPIIGIDLGKKD